MEFEWDPAKEAANLAKQGISFVAAAQVLERGTPFDFQSDRGGEPRWVAIGMHFVYVMREGRYRIISARRARDHEEKEYRKHAARDTQEAEHRPEARPDDER